MGASSDPPPDENPKKNDVVMGYPTSQETKYNQTQQMYHPPPPPLPPAPSHDPKSCESPSSSSSSSSYQQYPNPYAPSPYQPYAAPSLYQPYPPPPYQQAPPYNDYYYQQHLRHESGGGSAFFGRVLLALTLMLVASILMMSLIMWFLFGASFPEFEVGSIKVSNFSATNTSLSGTWSVQMWVSNVNMELDVGFDRAVASIFYKESMVGAAALQPFDVRKTQRFGLNFTVPALQEQRWVPPSLAEDRGGGVVVVSLRLAVDANFTAPNAVYRQERLTVLCEDFPIGFSSAASGEGALSPSFGNNCFIRLREGHD